VEVQSVASRLLGEHLGASRVAYAEDAGDGETVVLTRNYTRGVPGIEGRYRYRDYGENLVAEMRQGRHRHSARMWPSDPLLTEEEKAAHAVLQLGATLNVPLVKAGHLVAILAVHYVEPHEFPPEEIALVRRSPSAPGRRSSAPARKARLHESEELYRLIVKGARDYAIFTIDESGRITSWPPGAAAVFGWSEEEMIGAPFAKTFTEEDRRRAPRPRNSPPPRVTGSRRMSAGTCGATARRVFIEGAVLSLGRTDGSAGFHQDRAGRDRTPPRRRTARRKRGAPVWRSSRAPPSVFPRSRRRAAPPRER
jgi:PAS domain-containing protein